MSEWMKLIECKQTPSPIFTIFDYTKIVYPIESALCIRQVVTSGEKPSFIFIDHQMEEIQYISSLLNTIVTLQVYKDMYSLVFYDISGDYKSVKLNWELEGNLKVTCLNNNGTFIIVASSPNGNQVLFVDGRRKTIIGKGFFQKEVQELKNGPLETLSVLTTKG